MSRQLGSLHRSNSHPANLQNPVPIIPLFDFPPPDGIFNVPSNTDSDTNTDTSGFRTISQFNNSDLEPLANHYHLFPLPPIHLKSLQPIPHPLQTDHPIIPQISHNSPPNLKIISPSNNRLFNPVPLQ